MAEVSKGMFYKKVLDENGNLQKQVPFLPKTTAGLVVTEDGATVEKKLQDLANAKTYLTYRTLEEYMSDYNSGVIPAGTLAVVTDE